MSYFSVLFLSTLKVRTNSQNMMYRLFVRVRTNSPQTIYQGPDKWPHRLKICTKQGVNLKIRYGNGVLNDLTESLSTAVWGRRFQSTMVRVKNEAFLCCVLHSGTWYDWECMSRRASLRRSSRLRHLRYCSMSPTLDVLRCLLMTYLAALR
jgi:hypothetical protein